MNLIVAVDNKWAIGKNGNLLANIPTDLRFFKKKTLGKLIIMGRKTVDSLPGLDLLPYRTSLILTKNLSYVKDGAIVKHSLEETLAWIKKNCDGDDHIFICGGGKVYEAFMPYCKKAYITRIDRDLSGDVFILDFDKADNWEKTYTSQPINENGYSYTFNTYENKKVEEF